MILKKPGISIKQSGDTYGYSSYNVTIANLNYIGAIQYSITAYDLKRNIIIDAMSKTSEETLITERIFPAVYYDVEQVRITISAYAYYIDSLSETTVSELCESAKSRKFSGTSALSADVPYAYLKAFCNMPGEAFEPTYVYWESSLDGVTWDTYDLESTHNISPTVANVDCSVLQTRYDIVGNLVSDTDNVYVLRKLWNLQPKSCLDDVFERPDIVKIPNGIGLDNTMYRVTMCTVKNVSEEDTEYVDGAEVTVKTILGQMTYFPILSNQPELLESPLTGVSDSASTYYGSILYGYGNPELGNNLIATLPGESVRPLSQVTPVDVSDSTYITACIPWKEYVLCFTEHSAHLVSRISDGFKASTVNTFVGIPQEDYRCCKSTLNGIIFKSDDRIYMMYPNMYSGTDSVLNVTDISPPIESLLTEYAPTDNFPFAINTETSYILMLPKETSTLCVRYNYNTRVWNVHEYPVVFTFYEMFGVSDIRLIGYVVAEGVKRFKEFVLDADYAKYFTSEAESCPYADCLSKVDRLSNWKPLVASGILRPIEFALDSGQKSDTVANTRQFVETKFNVATLHDKDSFPIRITVHVDGMPSVTTKEVYTDSAFWKEQLSDVGTLSTEFARDNSSLFNVFRQMFIRYSGKGRSIRHIIEGSSLYPFKIYEINYRYRNLNIKN